MKRKNFRVSFKSLIVFLLVGVMAVSSAVTALIGINTVIPNSSTTNSAILAGTDAGDIASAFDPNKVLDAGKALSADDRIGLIIKMDDNCLIDTYIANPGKYASFAEYRNSVDGKNAAENLMNKQKALFNKIARQADVELLYNYVNIMNGFAIKITYKDRALIDKIASKSDVIGSIISETYAAPDTTVVENNVSAQSTGIFDSSASIAEGFGGQGIVAAVLDTGIDWEHIAFDPNNPIFASDDNVYKMDEAYIAERLSNLESAQLVQREGADREDDDDHKWDISSSYLTVKDVYVNKKVPYAYDYADRDTDVSSHTDNAHGSHVAGIVAGHSDDPYVLKTDEKQSGTVYLAAKDKNGKETGMFYTWENGQRVPASVTKDQLRPYVDKQGKAMTGITGVAPKAQLAIFKVFSDGNVGAPSEGLFAALEDCVTLGVDVINMSLGSDCGFQEDESESTRNSIYKAYDAVGKTGISLVIAASNSFSSGFSTHYGLNLISNPDSGTAGSPGSFDAGISVASIDGVKSKYLLAVDRNDSEYGTAYFTDAAHVNGESYDFIKEITEAVNAYIEKNPDKRSEYIKEDGSLRVPYVTIPGTGEKSNYAGKSVAGAIALVSRGTTTFEAKARNAEQSGALACIIYNNAAGTIRMQIGDDIHIPVCSISMDAASTIKNKDASGRSYFIINEKAEAGPFMNDFSSWGPLPNLKLKPEITAHGGEIYSAYPGDETTYSRISGTSMAAPNLAGVVAILRQYITSTVEKGNDQFGIDTDKSKTINSEAEKILMEETIYRILMSTTTIAMDYKGNPVSPRKQGAGLADLERSRKTSTYLYVEEEDGSIKSRTKVELGDDPERTGEYTVEFSVKNVGSSTETYKISSYVMTEGISSDGKTVNEMAHMLTGYTAKLKIDGADAGIGDNITVAGGKSVKVAYTITLGAADREWLAKFPNGMYVEGFVRLENTKNAGKADKDKDPATPDLSVPYLAFYGDWTDAPIFDYDIYQTSADAFDDSIEDDDKRYSGASPIQLIGKYVENGNDYMVGLGQYPFLLPDDWKVPAVEEDKGAISFNTNNGLCGLFCIGGFLRNAKKVFYTISDATTGEILIEDEYDNARKAAGAGGFGGAWLELDIEEILNRETGVGVANNSKYTVTIYPALDWQVKGYDFSKKDDVIRFYQTKNYNRCTCSDREKCAYEEDCVDGANCSCADTKYKYSWSSSFWIDTDAPFISNTEVRIEKDRRGNSSYYLDLYVTDNHYVSAIGFNYWDEETLQYVSDMTEGGYRPMTTGRNTTTMITYDLTTLWNKQIGDGLLNLRAHRKMQPDGTWVDDPWIKENPEQGTYLTQFKVTLFDFAMNKSYFTIDLDKLLQSANELAFGDIGNYSTYSKSDAEKIDVYVKAQDNIIMENGTEKLITSINMVPGQSLDIVKMIVAKPANAWMEDIIITCDPESGILRMDPDTFEIFTVGSGDAVVTIQSRANAKAVAKLNVHVLNEQEIDDYDINLTSIPRKTSLESLNFEYMIDTLNAGEHYDLEVKTDPWFIDIELGTDPTEDAGKYFFLWTSNYDDLARVTSKIDSAKATVVANMSRWENGKYVKNLTGDAIIQAQLCEINANGSDTALVHKETKSIVTAITNDEDVKEYFITNENGELVQVELKDTYEITYKATLYAAQFTAIVQPEFVVSGNTLTEYHGWPQATGGKLVIPGDDLNISTIGATVFYRRSDITSIEFCEGIETIDRAACAYMVNLREIVLPSTLLTVGEFAFAALFTFDYYIPDTQLSKVDIGKSKRPIQLGNYAFLFQAYIGIDFDNEKTDIVPTRVDSNGDPDVVRGLAFLPDEYEFEKKFDLSHVRTIGEYTFYGTEYVKSVDLTGLRSSGKGSFYGFGAGLYKFFTDDKGQPLYAKLTLGEHTSLGTASFVYSGIGELVVPMKRVTEQSFLGIVEFGKTEDDPDIPQYIGELKKITFTADDLVIEKAAFLYSSVEEIEFKGNVAAIGEAAFAQSQLKTIKFAEGKTCKIIADQAFMRCQLQQVTLPDGLERLGEAAFAFNESLVTVNLGKDFGNGVDEADLNTALSGSAFFSCEKLENFNVTDNDNFTSENGILYNKDKSVLICVPCQNSITDVNTILGSTVEKIGPYAFSNNANLETLDLSAFSQITELGLGAFYECKKLKSITLPKNITEIPDFCFRSCELLQNVNLGAAQITSIGIGAFYECAFSEFTIPSTVTTLGALAFGYNENLTSINIPIRIKEIPEACFYWCRNLRTVNFGYVTTIGNNAFTYSGITAVESSRIDTIGFAAFANCVALKKVELGNVTFIDEMAFMAGRAWVESEGSFTGNMTSTITDLSIPKVEKIGALAFAYQLRFPEDNSANNMSYVILNINSCTDIGENAFYGANMIRRLSFNSVERVGADAFGFTSIQTVALPASLKYMAPSAFTDTELMYYTLAPSENNTYFLDNGVLYREIPTGYELVSYPSRKEPVNIEYTILDGTVRVAEFAFASAEYITRVNIPASVQSIGDAAFYLSSISLYNFMGGKAPELEAYQTSFENEHNNVYYWQIYRNFGYPFSFSNGMLPVYKYNPIRMRTDDDVITVIKDHLNPRATIQIQNDSITGGGFSPYYYFYNIVLARPSNATGYDSFIWANYFDSVLLTPEYCTSETIETMNLIRALPDPSVITLADKPAVVYARSRFETTGYEQRQFIVNEGLLDHLAACEKKIASLEGAEATALLNVINLIRELPEPEAITAEHGEQVRAARAAYDALSVSNKQAMETDHPELLEKLKECESKLNEREEEQQQDGCGNCGSCGTLTFGAGSGGIGLMVGLVAVALVCFAIVLLRKRNTAK